MFNESDTTKMCGRNCGVCVLVSGSKGSRVYMINEIGDIGATGIAGQGKRKRRMEQEFQ